MVLAETDAHFEPKNPVTHLMTDPTCGQGLISHNFARKMIDWVKVGEPTPRQAARYLARPRVCGAFNIDRAQSLLAKAVEMA